APRARRAVHLRSARAPLDRRRRPATRARDVRAGPSRSWLYALGRATWFTAAVEPGRRGKARDSRGSGEDRRGDVVGWHRRVDDDEAVGLIRGEREEALADAAVELEVVGGFEPVDLDARLAGQSHLDRNVEEDRQVRFQAVGSEPFHRPQLVERQPTAVALVGQGR